MSSGVVGCKSRLEGAGSCNFLIDRCRFVTEKTMDAQNFNFAPNARKIGILAPNFVFFGRKFSDRLEFRGRTLPPCPRHDPLSYMLLSWSSIGR